jgi:transcriptional regulator with XRE-family HTH domain
MHIPGMRLSEWMKAAGIGDEALAQKVRELGSPCDRSQISKYRRGLIRPNWQTIRALYQVSDGDVSANDFLELEASP